MRSPILALYWQLWLRHRTALLSAAALFATTALAYPIASRRAGADFTANFSVLLMMAVFGLVLNALVFIGPEGKQASGYPGRLLVLPLTTRSLAASPLALGVVTMALLWFATAGLIYRPNGVPVPFLLPALGVTAGFAWIQLLSWLPVAASVLSLTLTALALVALMAFPVWGAITGGASRGAIAAYLTVMLAAAFPLACSAVAGARRGESWKFLRPGWVESFAPTRPALPSRPFRSPAEAQLWFEWRCHGLLLPATAVLGLVASAFATLSDLWKHGAATLRVTGAPAGFLPLFYAWIFGAALARNCPPWLQSKQGNEFTAIRPLTDRARTWFKYRMALRSVLLTWAIVVVGVAAELACVVAAGFRVEWLGDFWRNHPGVEGAAILVLGAVLLPAVTWKLLTDNLVPGLASRQWVVGTAWFAEYVAVCALFGFWLWGLISGVEWGRVLAGLPWLLATAAAIKIAVASLAFRAARKRGLMPGGAVAAIVVAWVAAAGSLVGLAAWLLPRFGTSAVWWLPKLGTSAIWSIVLPAIVVGVPLGRFALGPLALSWSRHRP